MPPLTPHDATGRHYSAPAIILGGLVVTPRPESLFKHRKSVRTAQEEEVIENGKYYGKRNT